MKIKLGRLLKGAVRVIEKNPKKALLVASIIAPGLAAKVASTVVKAKAAEELL